MKNLTLIELQHLFQVGALNFLDARSTRTIAPHTRYVKSYYYLPVYCYLSNPETDNIPFYYDKSIIKNLYIDEGIILPYFHTSIIDFYHSPHATDYYKEQLEKKLINIALLVKQGKTETVGSLVLDVKLFMLEVLSKDEKYCNPLHREFWSMAQIEQKKLQHKKNLVAAEMIAQCFENESDLTLFQQNFSHKTHLENVNFMQSVWLKAAKDIVKPYSLDNLPASLLVIPSFKNSAHQQHLDILSYYKFQDIKPVLELYLSSNMRHYVKSEVIQRIETIYQIHGEAKQANSPLIDHTVEDQLYRKKVILNYQFFQDRCLYDGDFITSLLETMKSHLDEKYKNNSQSYAELSYFHTKDHIHFVFLSYEEKATHDFQQYLEKLANYMVSKEFLNEEHVHKLNTKQFGRRTAIERDKQVMAYFNKHIEIGMLKHQLEGNLQDNNKTIKSRKI